MLDQNYGMIKSKMCYSKRAFADFDGLLVHNLSMIEVIVIAKYFNEKNSLYSKVPPRRYFSILSHRRREKLSADLMVNYFVMLN